MANSLQHRLNISERQTMCQSTDCISHCPSVSKQLCQNTFWENQLFHNVCKGAVSWDCVLLWLLLISYEMSVSMVNKEVWVWWDVTGRESLSVKWHLSRKQKKAGEWVTGQNILGRGYVKDKGPDQFGEQQGQSEWDTWIWKSVAALPRDEWGGLNSGSNRSGTNRDCFTGYFEDRTFKVC